MPQVNLLAGAYEARSVIAGAQRCVNLYTEKNPEDSKASSTHYPTPGFKSLAVFSPRGCWRGFYASKAKPQKLFGVCGSQLCYINDRWEFQVLGTLRTAGKKSISMSDNGIDLLVVDGSPFGYVVNLTSLEFSEISSDQDFYGGSRVDVVDTYFVVSEPSTSLFRVSDSNSTTFAPLNFAQKVGRSDALSGVAIVHRELWLIGEATTEVWFNSGNPIFPFEIVSGAFLEVGCIAPGSIASHGNSILWLSLDDKGQALVAMSEGYKAKRVTTRAIESEFSKFAKIDDAVGLVYQFKGHLFYALTFPSANQTWVYDLLENTWHEGVWSDMNGVENRVRFSAIAFAYGKLLAGDRENGDLYELDEENSVAIGSPIKRLRSLPALSKESAQITDPVLLVDMEVGSMKESDNMLTLRHSGNYGKTWSDGIMQSLGARGEYDKHIKFSNLGHARNRVYELSWTGEGASALQSVSISPFASDT